MLLRRLWPALALTLVAILTAAGTGQAHAYLDASTPPPNGTTVEGKTVLAVRFTEVIDPDHTRVRLEGPHGASIPTVLDQPVDRPRVLRIEVAPLAPGSYELAWSSFSIDSHVDHGTVPFTVAKTAAPGTGDVQAFDPGAQDPTLVALETVGRLLFLLGALAAFGLPIYVLEIDPGDGIPEGTGAVLVASGIAGVAGAGLLFTIMVERLGTGPWPAASTLPGRFLLGKAALLTTITVAACWMRRAPDRRATRALVVSLVAAMGTLVLHSMSGHGVLEMSSRDSAAGHVAMTLHLAASGAWIGGLVGLLLTVRHRGALVERIRAFTPLAIVSVLAIGATGLVQAYVHLPSLAALWMSGFGWALLAKTGLFVSVLGLGAWHGFGLPQRLEAGSHGRASFLSSGTGEVVLLGLVVLAAGVMGALPVPPEEVNREDGPLAILEEDRRLPNHDIRLRILDDPLRAGETVPVDLTVQPTSSVGVAETRVEVNATGPGNRSIDLDLAPVGETGAADTGRLWRDRAVTFPHAGNWTLTLELTGTSGSTVERFAVQVQPHLKDA